ASIGEWWVTFGIDRSSDDGWFALEFLSWLVNHDCRRAGFTTILLPYAYPPYLNTPGESLRFQIQGAGDDPDELARLIDTLREECYISPADVAAADAETERIEREAGALNRLEGLLSARGIVADATPGAGAVTQADLIAMLATARARLSVD